MNRDEGSRARRISNFSVKVSLARNPEFEGEIAVEYTNNGFQWNIINLLPENAPKFVAAILKHMGEPVAWMNTEGLVSAASGGGYDIPLYAVSTPQDGEAR